MQIQSALISLALVAGTASAAYEHAYTNGTFTITKVWDAVTTYCPQPTTLCFNNRTYTIEQPTTFIIPDCPCTQTYTTNQCSECQHPTGYVVPNPPAQTGTGDVPPAVPTQTGLITCPGSPYCPPGASGSILPPAQTGSAGLVCPGSPYCPPAASGGSGGASGGAGGAGGASDGGAATPSQTGALVCPGSPNCPATGSSTAAGGAGGSGGAKPSTVVVAGAEKNVAAAGVALVAGFVAVLAL
ncbi:hypothetical protein CSAL01_10765 [Colletotrichum salicis]|uniref:Mmc protein n=1 Tax=Colletotrichum salicis TaxID=1209931 RepID=A0A135V172_9PEZI|nr:hypothetical protein CSAL01_10765 [Colletotrichum salicis]